MYDYTQHIQTAPSVQHIRREGEGVGVGMEEGGITEMTSSIQIQPQGRGFLLLTPN